MKNDPTIKGYLEQLEIRGFRSLKEVSITLSPLTVLIGANGAGKSNFIQFFNWLSWLIQGNNVQEIVARNGGADDQLFLGSRITNSIEAKLSISSKNNKHFYNYAFSLIHTSANDQLVFGDERCKRSQQADLSASGAGWFVLNSAGRKETKLLDFAKDHAISLEGKQSAQKVLSVMTYLLKRCRAYQFHDTSQYAMIKKRQDTSDCTYLNSDGGNLAAVLLNLSQYEPKRLNLVEKQIARILSTFAGFVLEEQHGKVMLRWRHKQGGKVIGAHLTSDGSLRLFCLVTLLNLPSEMLPDVILLDEPELGLHPTGITLIAAMIRRVSHSQQIILATQSPYMVDCFELDTIVVADLEEGATCLRSLNKKDYQKWLDDSFSVSDLWLSNVIGGQP